MASLKDWCRRRCTPADGRYAWLIVVAVFAMNVFNATYNAGGIMFVEFLEYFQKTKVVTSGISTLESAIEGLGGILAGACIHKFGCRKVAILGSITGCASYIIGSMAPSIYILYLTRGLLLGIACALCSISGNVIVHQYMSRRRTLASAILFSSYSVAGIVYPPLAQRLVFTYGWRGTYLIFGGVWLQILPLAGLYRKPTKVLIHAVNATSVLHRSEDDTKCLNERNPGHVEQVKCDKTTEIQNSDFLKDSHRHQNESSNTVSADSHPHLDSTDDILLPGQNITYRNSQNHKHSKPAEAPEGQNGRPEETNNVFTLSKVKQMCLMTLRVAFDLELLRNVMFIIYCSFRTTSLLIRSILTYMLPARAVAQGLPKMEAAFLVSIIGISQTVSRLLAGYVGDLRRVNRRIFCSVWGLLAGLLLLCTFFMKTYNHFVTYSLIFGITTGCHTGVEAALGVDLIGVHRLARGFGFISFVTNYVYVLWMPISALLVDHTGSYVYPYILLGALHLVTSGSLILYPAVRLFIERRSPRAETNTISREKAFPRTSVGSI